jgi:PBP1b-binding outer membrane lipoprotein LpoB
MKKIFYSLILSTLMFGACSTSDDGVPQAPESPDGTQDPQEEPVTYPAYRNAV